jgi:predicted Holliday junction resolvase-like endonuclease
MDMLVEVIITGFVVIVCIVGYVYFIRRTKQYLEETYKKRYEDQLSASKETIRKEYEAVYAQKAKKSNDAARNAIRGQVLQQFIPTLTGKYNPYDYRFLGDFADYIVIDGYTDVKDGVASDVKEIVFLEIKTGESKLSKHQKAVQRAIQEGRVVWGEIKLDAQGNII